MDFSDADLANDQQLNQAIWPSVKGADIPMPGPHTATPTAPLSPTAVTPGPNARVASGSPAATAPDAASEEMVAVQNSLGSLSSPVQRQPRRPGRRRPGQVCSGPGRHEKGLPPTPGRR